MLMLSVAGTVWFRPSQTIFFDKYVRQFDDDNIGESSLSSNEDEIVGENERSSIPRIDNLPLRVNDVYVLDANSNYTKRTKTQSTDENAEDDMIRSSRFM